MSGIAGIVNFDGAPVEPGLIEMMTASMSYRGPNGIHHWQSASIALGQCMLRTTPESLEEVQPWLSENERYVLVMDGRLDNWEELRRSLELRGCRLRNRSDAELIVQAFQLWGIECLKHIEGDFAFVVWDSEEKKLHCIRDRMGGKSFNYHWNGKTFVFGTDIHSIMQLPWVPQVCNENVLVDYLLANWCSRSETPWKDIHRLPAAQRLEIDASGFRQMQYWQPALSELQTFDSDEEYIECYKSLLFDAVRRSSRSQGPLGIEVSGGLDSSALFAVADKLHKSSRLLSPDIEGYTLSFPDDPDANELAYASAVGTHLGRRVHEIRPSQPSLDWLSSWARMYKEFPPYPNGIMSLGIRESARSGGSKALIVGVGGDEWLDTGRSYYSEELQAKRWSQLAACLQSDRREFGAAQSLWWLFRQGFVPSLPASVKRGLRAALPNKRPFGNSDTTLLSPKMREIASGRRVELAANNNENFTQYGQQAKWQTLFSPTNIFAREAEERMAAMRGLELRLPFFNLHFVQFAFSSPDRIRVRGRTNKFVHRQAMTDLLPEAVLNRKTKADFSVVYRRYLKDMENHFCQVIAHRRQGWINAEKLAEMYGATSQDVNFRGVSEWQLWGLFGCDALYL